MPGEFDPNVDDASFEGYKVSDIAEAVGADLFGGDPPQPEAPDLGRTAAPSPEGQPGLTAAEIKALPKTWKKDMEGHWSRVPKEAQDYIYEREAQVARGIGEYSQGHKAWTALMSPYQQLMQQHPNINPVELMQGLMNAHLRIIQSPPDQRKALASQMMQAYGVDLSASVKQQADTEHSEEYLDVLKKNQALEARLASLENHTTSSIRAKQEAEYQSNLKTVEAFLADPKNLHVKDVENELLRLLQTGAATSLEQAYNMACWTNPAVREKLLSEKSLENQAPGNTGKRSSNFPNINGSSNAVPRQQRKGSIEDTIDGVVAKHYGTH